ncbi:hypothetical protein BSKO_03119 [Bryopsis sp. KO-2023]|nr:hypothetical protein BSKO_03119 [Bryopsis sp. KO-2023]
MGMFFATIGRFMVAIIFVVSGLSKLEKMTGTSSAELVKQVEPKLDHALNQVEKYTGIDVPVKADQYPTLILAGAVAEIAGGALFFFNLSLGGFALILFLVGVTPIFHNFWDEEAGSPEQLENMMHFLKNVSIAGGILAYTAKPIRRKEKND